MMIAHDQTDAAISPTITNCTTGWACRNMLAKPTPLSAGDIAFFKTSAGLIAGVAWRKTLADSPLVMKSTKYIAVIPGVPSLFVARPLALLVSVARRAWLIPHKSARSG